MRTAILCTISLLLISCGEGGGGDRDAFFSVTFPTSESTVFCDTVTVHGRAPAGAGIIGIDVAGVAAVTDDDFLTWRATVPLAPGRNVLDIGVLTAAGNIMPADSVAVRFEGPFVQDLRGLALDEASGRAFAADAERIVALDLASGLRSVVSSAAIGAGPPLVDPRLIAHDAAGGRLFVADMNGAGFWRIDVATGDRTVVSPAGPLSINELRWDASSGRLLALVYAPLAAAIVTFDPIDGEVGLLLNLAALFAPGSPLIGPPSPLIAIDAPRSRVLAANAGGLFAADLVLVPNLETLSAASDPGPVFVQPRRIAVQPSGGAAFVLDGDRLIAVDLTNGERSLVRDGLAGVTGLAATDERVLWIESDALQSVDLSTLETVLTSGARRGTGPAVPANPRFAGFAADGRIVLHAPTRQGFFAVDPVTGDREPLPAAQNLSARAATVGELDVFAEGIAVDQPGIDRGLLRFDPGAPDLPTLDFASTAIGRDVVRDPTSDVTMAFVGDFGVLVVPDEGLALYHLVQFGSTIPAMVHRATLDPITGRILISADDVIGEIEPPPGAGFLISTPSHGQGPSFVAPRGLDVDCSGETAWVVDTALQRLIRVDRITGDRTVTSSLPADLTLAGDVLVDAARRIAYVTIGAAPATGVARYGLAEIDLVSGEGALISR